MNINDFGIDLAEYLWKPMLGRIGSLKMTFFLPYTERQAQVDPDLRNAEVFDYWWLTYHVSRKSNSRALWWGVIHNKERGMIERHYPLILELDEKEHYLYDCIFYVAATPPGRVGFNATILIDKEGEIVPELLFLPEGRVKIFLLSTRTWEEFAWNHIHAGVALQFTDGFCDLPGWRINKWQSYLMRNRC